MQSPTQAENGIDGSVEEEFDEDFPGYYKRTNIKGEIPPKLAFDEVKGKSTLLNFFIHYVADDQQAKELRQEDEEMRPAAFSNGQGNS